MPTDLPEKPKPNPIAVAIGKGALKVAEYVMDLVVHAAYTAFVAFVVMLALGVMHQSEPAVPLFGFMFLWPAVWGSATLAYFAGSIVNRATKEDE